MAIRAFSAKAGMVISAAAALAVGLSACGGASDDSADLNYLNYVTVATVQTADCNKEKAELEKALKYVNEDVKGDSNMEKAVTEERNPQGTTLEDVTKALESKIKDCGGPSALSAIDKEAEQVCGDNTVNACKVKGTEVFNSLPADRRGDENASPSPANFHKELKDLEDQPQKLERALWLVKVLNGFKAGADSGTPADQAALAAQLHALLPNATQADVNIGSQGNHAVDWALNAQEERGAGSFTKRTLKTPAEVGAYLREDTPESKEAQTFVVKAIKDAGYGDDEVARALTGEGYIPIQMKDASQVLGTSYFKDGKVLIAGTWRQANAGDVYWLYITKDGKLIQGALVRAGCGNMNAKAIMVVRPGMPSAPSIELPPGEESCPPGTIMNPETGLCDQPPSGDCKEPNTCTPPTTQTCPPGTPHGTWPKCKDSDGNLVEQGPGPGTNIDPGPGTRPTMDQPPATSRVDPPPMTTNRPAPPPVVQPTVIPSQPTVVPSAEPTQTGTLPGDPGCGNPELC